jgi:hypothetical protein
VEDGGGPWGQGAGTSRTKAGRSWRSAGHSWRTCGVVGAAVAVGEDSGAQWEIFAA